MKKIYFLLIMVLFLITSCTTTIQTQTKDTIFTSEELSSPTSNSKLPESETPAAILKIINGNCFLKIESIPIGIKNNDRIMIWRYENGILKNRSGINFHTYEQQLNLHININPTNEIIYSLTIFYDENDNYMLELDEWRGVVEIPNPYDSNEELPFQFIQIFESDENENYDDFVFEYPEVVHDLSMNSEPPIGFNERENEYGIGIIDFHYSKPIWLYEDMDLEQLALLFPDAILDGRVFHLADGGFIIINFEENGSLSQFYPRDTNRFTLVGFPKLPWDHNQVKELFGSDSGMGEDTEVYINMGVNSGLNGFRIDSRNYMITGFRIWMPDS